MGKREKGELPARKWRRKNGSEKVEKRETKMELQSRKGPVIKIRAMFTPGMRLLPMLLMWGVATGCAAQMEPAGSAGPALTLELDGLATAQGQAGVLQILLLSSVLALAPAILTLVTAFTRIVIVLSVVRNAIGTPQIPPNQVVLGLALLLTFFVMAPVWNVVQQEALQPYLAGELDQATALQAAVTPVRDFMLRQTREEDLALFVGLAQLDPPRTADDIPTYVVVPSFVISELRTAFQMAFVIYVPFLVIDMIVSTTMLSIGMFMVPPTLISLPFKLLLFVMVDGWHLLSRSLVLSFQ